jgi:hypothetical protein
VSLFCGHLICIGCATQLTVREPPRPRQKKKPHESISCPVCKADSDTKHCNPKPYLILYPPKKFSVQDKDALDVMRVSNENLTRRVLELEVQLDTQRKKAKSDVAVLEARVEDGERRLVEAAKRVVETTASVKLETASFVFSDEEEEVIQASSSSFQLTDKLVLSPGGSVVIL